MNWMENVTIIHLNVKVLLSGHFYIFPFFP